MNSIPSLWPGVLCNSQCPDTLQLDELTSNNWHTSAKVIIALLIICLSIVCIIVKVVFRLWLVQLEKKQKEYLRIEKSEVNKQKSAKVECLRERERECLHIKFAISFG